MKHYYNWDMEYLDRLIPYERDLYMDMLIEAIEKEKREAQNA